MCMKQGSESECLEIFLKMGGLQKSWPTFFKLLERSLLTFLDRSTRLFRAIIPYSKIPTSEIPKIIFIINSIKTFSTITPVKAFLLKEP